MQRDRHEKYRGDRGQPSIAAPSLAEPGGGTWARIRYSAGGAISWSVSGTSSLSSTATIDYATQPANAKKVFHSTFQYKKFSASCISGLVWVFIGHFVRPTAFQGGVSSYTAAAAPTATNCSGVTSSTWPVSLTKQTAEAWTLSRSRRRPGGAGNHFVRPRSACGCQSSADDELTQQDYPEQAEHDW